MDLGLPSFVFLHTIHVKLHFPLYGANMCHRTVFNILWPSGVKHRSQHWHLSTVRRKVTTWTSGDLLKTGYVWSSMKCHWKTCSFKKKVLENVFTKWQPLCSELYFTDMFRCIFLNEKFWIMITISLKFVPKGPINNNPASTSHYLNACWCVYASVN